MVGPAGPAMNRSTREVNVYSIEFVDGLGRKVRVGVTGHWGDLNRETAETVVRTLQDREHGGLLALSDFEESDTA